MTTVTPAPLKQMAVLNLVGGPKGRIFQGVFGELVDRHDDGTLTIKLDDDLIECSTLLAPYKEKALSIHESEVTIIETTSQAQHNSLRATLAHVLGVKWNEAYDGLLGSHDGFVAQALDIERSKANEAVSALIRNAGACPVMLSVAKAIYAETDEDDEDDENVYQLDSMMLYLGEASPVTKEQEEAIKTLSSEFSEREHTLSHGVNILGGGVKVYLDQSESSAHSGGTQQQAQEMLQLLHQDPDLGKMMVNFCAKTMGAFSEKEQNRLPLVLTEREFVELVENHAIPSAYEEGRLLGEKSGGALRAIIDAYTQNRDDNLTVALPPPAP